MLIEEVKCAICNKILKEYWFFNNINTKGPVCEDCWIELDNIRDKYNKQIKAFAKGRCKE